MCSAMWQRMSCGLTGAMRREAEARFAQAAAHQGRIPAGVGVQGQMIQVHSHTYLDGHEIAHTVTQHQETAGVTGLDLPPVGKCGVLNHLPQLILIRRCQGRPRRGVHHLAGPVRIAGQRLRGLGPVRLKRRWGPPTAR